MCVCVREREREREREHVWRGKTMDARDETCLYTSPYLIQAPPPHILQEQCRRIPMPLVLWVPPCNQQWACPWRVDRTGTATSRQPSSTIVAHWPSILPLVWLTLMGRSLSSPLTVSDSSLPCDTHTHILHANTPTHAHTHAHTHTHMHTRTHTHTHKHTPASHVPPCMYISLLHATLPPSPVLP